METPPPYTPAPSPQPGPAYPGVPEKRHNPWKIFGIVVACLLVLFIGAALWWWWINRMPRPVVLTQPEIGVLEDKLTAVSGEPVTIRPSQMEGTPELIKTGDVPAVDPVLLETDPEKRRDLMSDPDRRTLVFTEREVNGFINHNTGLADTVFLELGDDAIVARFAYTFEEDVPMVGGMTLKLRCRVGARLDAATRKPFLALHDVTLNGLPIPNAWLGEIKNKNLFDAASDAEPTGFLKTLADGIEDIELRNGQLRIRLAP